MIRQIIWDFDGVIIFSHDIRNSGFMEVLQDYDPEAVEKLMKYHSENGGLSRYVKFRYFFEKVLGQPADENMIMKMADDFSAIMKQQMTDPGNLNEEVLDFIRSTQNLYTHHIASGSDGNELRYLCEKLLIDTLFKSIHGSPVPKTELVAGILGTNPFTREETCLIGDAMNDYEAAQKNGIAFLGYNNNIFAENNIKTIDSFYSLNLNQIL